MTLRRGLVILDRAMMTLTLPVDATIPDTFGDLAAIHPRDLVYWRRWSGCRTIQGMGADRRVRGRVPACPAARRAGAGGGAHAPADVRDERPIHWLGRMEQGLTTPDDIRDRAVWLPALDRWLEAQGPALAARRQSIRSR